MSSDDPRQRDRIRFENPVLETERLRLRTWRADELDRITTARTNQATAHFLPFIPQPFTAEDARFWLGDLAEQAAAGLRFNWCVADRASDVALGNLTLFNLGEGGGELGFWAHPDAQGRGVVAEAVRRVSVWFFGSPADGGFGGRRLAIRTAATNRAARRVAESAGFREDGIEREAFWLGSGVCDDRVSYELVKSDQSAVC
ncbi:GNAT family N-acetyltransferase [Kribbella sp. CA-293567]|uniref:GNAT family N-acetyltransferase n=1 Tax=Kribbella sp. CA-293567 TaxID=3002436 RepID=UPI0022DE4806|nr:GNAT family N-acetyltransferase [Kribbella sp. CA-293567]WBQ07010.1 GNAT family N-acetyltransferase [Kribbella sp. CA-293567]